MRVTRTVWRLEMTHPSFLRPATGGPHFDLEPCGRGDHSEFARLHGEMGRAHFWSDRDEWDLAQWQQWLGRPELHAWKIVVDKHATGIIELVAHKDGSEVELETFGLIPRIIGTGVGGAALTRGTVLAWELAFSRFAAQTP
jgi:hypothetical protein